MASRPTAPAIAAIGLLAVAGCVAPTHDERSWTLMGESASVEVYTVVEADAARALEEIPRLMSSFAAVVDGDDPDSELSRLNREAASGFYRVQDRDLFRCLLLGLDYARASRGLFDPTVGPLTRLYRDPAGASPARVRDRLGLVGWSRVSVAEEVRAVRFLAPGMALDLGGVAKGFAIDVGARAFTRPGNEAALLGLGGNFYAWGRPPGREAWSLAVPDPREPGRPLLVVRVANRGVNVTRRPGDVPPPNAVLDPSTGLPATSDVRVAVALADSGADADAVSTALVVGGSHRGAELLERTRRVEAILVVDGEQGPEVLASGSLVGRFDLSPELERETGGRVRYLLPPDPSHR